MKWYLIRLLLTIDQFFNVLLSPLLNLLPNLNHQFGHHDETISSVLGKSKDSCKLCGIVCKLLACFDNRHCIDAVKDDR